VPGVGVEVVDATVDVASVVMVSVGVVAGTRRLEYVEDGAKIGNEINWGHINLLAVAK
jgi:hypothetical protein